MMPEDASVLHRLVQKYGGSPILFEIARYIEGLDDMPAIWQRAADRNVTRLRDCATAMEG